MDIKRDFLDGNGNLKKNQITPPSESIGGAVGGGAELSSKIYRNMYIGINPPPPTPTMLVQAEGVAGDPKAEIDTWAERESDSAESPLPPPSEVGGGGRANE